MIRMGRFCRRWLPWILSGLALLVVFAWIGIYLQWRKETVGSRMGRWISIRLVVAPPEAPDLLVRIMHPLAKVDGWLTGDSVSVGKIVVSPLGPNLKLPDLDWEPGSFGNEETEAR